MPTRVDFKNKVLVLRLNRLGHVPPALYATKALEEAGIKTVTIEFDKKAAGDIVIEKDGLLRLRLSVSSRIPEKLKNLALFLKVFVVLFFSTRRRCPKLVISHGLQEQVLALWSGLPYVAHVHEIYDKAEGVFNRFLLRWEKRALNKARFLIFPDEQRAEFYRTRYGLTSPKIIICHNCPPLRRKKTLSDLSEEGSIMVYLGGVGASNRLELGVEALPYVNGLRFFIFGWEDKSVADALKEKARALGVEDRVIFGGEIRDETKKWEWLERADFAYCVYDPVEVRLRHVAFASNKLMEAIAAGCPVITSDNADFKKAVEKEGLGLCVPLTTKAVSEAIQRLSQDREFRQKAKIRAVRLHQEIFNFEFQFQGALREFREICDEI